MYATLGCPLAGLVRDLRHATPALGADASRVYQLQQAWLDAQFTACRFALEAARDHARHLMAAHHGAILPAFAQDNLGIVDDATARLTSWLRTLLV